MNSKFLIAGLMGAFTSFFLGWLLYGTLLAGMLSEATMAGVNRSIEEFKWPFLILSNLASGYFLSYVFSKWANITTFNAGLSAGAIIGLFVSLMYNFAYYATTHMMTLKGYLLDIVATIVITAIVGGVVGWWLGRGK